MAKWIWDEIGITSKKVPVKWDLGGFWYMLNLLRPRQNGRHFADDTLNRIFLNENVRISIKISLKFAPKGPFNNIPALVQIKAWRRPGDKPLSEPMMVRLPTHICVTRPQWVNSLWLSGDIWHQISWSTLVQLMACHMFHAKQLPEPMLTYSQLDHLKVKFESKYKTLFMEDNAFGKGASKMVTILSQPQSVNSLRPSDAIWWHRSESTLAQVMACCLTAPSHYLNQCWLIISKV